MLRTWLMPGMSIFLCLLALSFVGCGINYAEEQNKLGDCYYFGKGGKPKDYVKAAECFQKAADAGDAEGQYNVGVCYYYERGKPKDYTKAAEWFQKSADQGYHKAQFRLGRCYEDGNGVEKNKKKAMVLFRKAAAHGDEYSEKVKLYVFCIEFGECCEKFKTKVENLQDDIKRNNHGPKTAFKMAGDCFKQFAREATSVVDKHDIPGDVRTAALEFIQFFSEYGEKCWSVSNSTYDGFGEAITYSIRHPVSASLNYIKLCTIAPSMLDFSALEKDSDAKAKKLERTLIDHGINDIL